MHRHVPRPTDKIKIDDTLYETIPDHQLPEAVIEVMSYQSPAVRGSYQRALLLGHENWSGSSLQGKAAKNGASYAASRNALAKRLQDRMPDGWTITTKLVLCGSPRRWRRELVLYSPDNRVHVW